MRSRFKIIVFSFTLVTFSFSFAGNAHAYMAWPDLMAMSYKEALEKITKMINDFMLGGEKLMAAMQIDDNVNTLVSGGSSSGSMFINDWEDYLYLEPRKESAVFMNDFFTDVTRGRSSGLNYSSVCGGSFSRGSYSDYLVQRAKKRTIDIEMPQMDLQEYVCDAVDMFEDETWRAFFAFADPNKINNPLGFGLISQQVYSADRERRQDEAAKKAISYHGYKPQTSRGRVTTPGSTIEAMVADAKDVPNKIVAGAGSIPEVILSIVMRYANETIQQGIGNAQSNIQREMGNRDSNYSRGMSSNLEGQSPEKSFDQTDISQNSPAHLFYDIK